MEELSTEDGCDCSVGHLLCDVEGCCARQVAKPSASSLHVPLPLRKEARCFCRPLRAALMKAVLPSLSACPLVLHKQPTASACPQMTSSPPVASAAPRYSGGRASEGLARSGRPDGVSTECWALPSARQRRVGQLLGPPSALLWLSEWGPHCFCRPDLTHGAEAVAAPPWSDCKECAAASLLAGRP